MLRCYADLAVEGLGAAREEIDALNVYPVPDGDTGTNMFLTVEAARDEMVERLDAEAATAGYRRRVQSADRTDETGLRTALVGYARGALLGARGNSGVILSQLVGALLRRIGSASPDDRAAVVFADGMRRAADAAWAAVGEPVEGTILSVANAAAAAAQQAALDPAARLEAVIHEAVEAARARPWPARPSRCRCCATPVWSTPAAGDCAWCWRPPSRRSPGGRRRPRAPGSARPASRPRSSPVTTWRRAARPTR